MEAKKLVHRVNEILQIIVGHIGMAEYYIKDGQEGKALEHLRQATDEVSKLSELLLGNVK